MSADTEVRPEDVKPAARARLAVLARLRYWWRQLTSMRTALVLLFLLAVAAIPGSILPQRSVNIEKVDRYFTDHPDAAPVLDKLWGFDVFSSPWFGAIYLLLFTSLIGCVTPRLREHWRAIRAVVPDAPRRLDRLPQHATLAAHPDESTLRGWRTARRQQPDGTVTVAAEKGYLKETGNLLFHAALMVILIGVGLGAERGWHANRLLIAGPDLAFCNTLQQYDDYGLGPMVGQADLPRFCLELTEFQATYRPSGMAESYAAQVKVSGQENRTDTFGVNDPLRLDGANVYLLGNGYAPVLRYTDATGKALTVTNAFLPVDGMLTSEGAALFPDANGGDRKQQIGFEGLYLPTETAPPFVRSEHPQERAPKLVLTAYKGDLGLDSGIGGSVYKLNKTQVMRGLLAQYGESKMLRPGESWTLDDGSKVEFLGTKRWITISVRSDPGEPIVLAGAALLLVGLPLSLYGKRRRVWLRLHSDGTAEVGGLPRTEYPGFADEFHALLERWQRK